MMLLIIEAIFIFSISFKVSYSFHFSSHTSIFKLGKTKTLSLSSAYFDDLEKAKPNVKKTLVFKKIENVNKSNSYKDALLVYLPGIDGIGSYSFPTLQNMSETYNVYQMTVSPNDRSSFVQSASDIVRFLNDTKMSQNTTEVVLVGESIGAIFALYISLQYPTLINKLILINSATSFDKTIWKDIDKIIPYVPPPLFPFAFGNVILATVAGPGPILSISKGVVDRINTSQDALREANTLLQYFQFGTDSRVLQWRLSKWLRVGLSLIKGKLSDLTLPILILAGEDDRLLPSANEALDLRDALVNAQIEEKEFSKAGHALLADVPNISKIILNSRTLTNRPLPPPKEIKVDFPYPSPEALRKGDDQLRSIRQAVSPVFLQRSGEKQLKRGIKGLPVGSEGRPVLLVGNHQLIGLDIPLLAREFLVEREELVRGLAHPIIFASPEETSDSKSEEKKEERQSMNAAGALSPDFFKEYGAVEVSPSSLYQLLKANATVLLYPGGVTEALHGKGDQYKLFWPEKTDFIRMAALFDAIIIPFASIGVDDSIQILLDGKEILEIPYFGDKARRFSRRVPKAKAASNESFVTPFALPARAPERVYIMFDEPFDTRSIDVYNKTKCREAYSSIRSQVEDSISTLLRFRDNDPYHEFGPRITYELATGNQAPTTPLNAKLDL